MKPPMPLTKSQHARAHGSLNALLPALISGGLVREALIDLDELRVIRWVTR